MRLEYLSLYVLDAMNRTRATPLDGLEPGVLPIAPQSRSFTVTSVNGKRISICRQQLSITPAYAFTDYRVQAQTIEYCVVDIGTPPSVDSHRPIPTLRCRAVEEEITSGCCVILTKDCLRGIQMNTYGKRTFAYKSWTRQRS